MISISERLAIKGEAEKRGFDNFSWSLRCASPGIVQSFDAEKQTVVVQLAITEKIKCNNEEFTKEHDGDNVASIPVPLLMDVPICIPSAGGFSLTVPVKAGDECLVVFSDTCFDEWYQNGCPATDKYPNGEPQNQMAQRRHDLSDGFAIMGINSQPKKLPGYSENTVQLRTDDGQAYVEVTLDHVVNVVAPGNVNIITKDANLNASGDVTVECKKAEITAPDGVFVNADIAVVGKITATGGITAGKGTAQEVEFQTHVHIDTEPGPGDSGIPKY